MFRFTIRDLIWLTVVVAFACAWWLEHKRIDARLVREEVRLSREEARLATWARRNDATRRNHEREKMSLQQERVAVDQIWNGVPPEALLPSWPPAKPPVRGCH